MRQNPFLMRAVCLLLLLVAAGAARAAPVAVVHAALGKPGEQLQATLVNTGDAHTEVSKQGV